MPITVLLADDSDLVRRAIRRLLKDHPKINVIGEAADFTQTMRMIQELQPQIVILDTSHLAVGVAVVRIRLMSESK
jgi:DNA-binding NarL/FixJ family response regulator